MSSEKNDRTNMAKHILPTFSNLLGLCFGILSFITILGLAHEAMIPSIIAFAIVLFLSASIISYTSMRSLKKAKYYERIAEFIFLGGMSLMGTCAVAVTFAIV
ncbi:MAG: hypothetical protein WA610_12575 [Thermodesulfovibrionales bacterium]